MLGQINSNVHYVIFWIIFIYVFMIIQTTVAMNKVKTIDKVNLSMMFKSPYITVVDNINAFFCDTSFYHLFKDK